MVGPGAGLIPQRTRRPGTASGWRVAGLGLVAAVPLLVLGLFFLYPVIGLIGRGLHGPQGWDLGVIGQVLDRPRFGRILRFTVLQAAGSALLAVLLGLPGAHLLYRRNFRGRAALRALVTVPFVLPTVVVGLAFRSVVADSGPLGGLGLDGSLTVILAAHVFLNYAVVVRTVGSTWAQLDTRAEEAARSLGAGPVRVFRTITLPALGPAIAAAALMVFLFCATSFGVMIVLGGAQYSTLETEIYRQTTEIGDLSTAAVLSITQLVLVGLVLGGSAVVRRRTESTLRLRTPGPARRLRRGDLPAVAVTVLMAVLLLAPMLVLLLRSLQTPGGWGWDNYRALGTLGEKNVMLVSAWSALGTSVRMASLGASLAVLLGLLLSVVLSRRPRRALGRRLIGLVDGAVMLPLGVSAVTLGFGFLITLDRPPLDLRSSPLLVPIAQALIATPLVVRMVLPVLRGADTRLREAAAVLGAGPVRVWREVDLPLMSRALGGAAAFAFVVCLGEFGATSFLARPEDPTLPVVIARLISRPGAVNTGMALAAGVVLAALCAVVVFLVDRISSGRRAAPGISGMGAF